MWRLTKATLEMKCKHWNVYLSQYKICNLPHFRSTVPHSVTRFNNYRCCQRKLARNEKFEQEYFYAHFDKANRCGAEDWITALINKVETGTEWYMKKSFWQNELNTSVPCGLNERTNLIPVYFFPLCFKLS